MMRLVSSLNCNGVPETLKAGGRRINQGEQGRWRLATQAH